MANFICEFEGVRGRYLKLYDTKCVIITRITAGSVLTGNFTDGEKTLFYTDIVGVQFKKSGALVGYLQFETPSMQMNNKDSNMFSENTFTFESDKNGITNRLMEAVYNFLIDRIEEIKYGTSIVTEIPDFESMKIHETRNSSANFEATNSFAGSKSLYDAAYIEHYTNDNIPKALIGYLTILKDFPLSKEAGYSKTQINNIKASINIEILEIEQELKNIYYKHTN